MEQKFTMNEVEDALRVATLGVLGLMPGEEVLEMVNNEVYAELKETVTHSIVAAAIVKGINTKMFKIKDMVDNALDKALKEADNM